VRGPAEESTCRRAFALVRPDVLDRALGVWLRTRAVRAGGRLVIAVDGKTVRGAKDRAGQSPHLVAALAHGIGVVLGQVAVDAKPNEIPAVRELLKAFAGLAGAVITIDAIHAQHDTARLIIGEGRLRDDREVQHARLVPAAEGAAWAAVPAVSAVSTDHGRRALGSSSRALPRSLSCAAPSRRRARIPLRSCASIPATATLTRRPWPPGSAVSGRSRTSSTGSVLQGSSACCMTWHWSASRRASATPPPCVVLVVVAAQRPAGHEPATYATPLTNVGSELTRSDLHVP
jgi:predicted transposase YbfD/YdcC